MNKYPILAAAAAVTCLALGACHRQPEVVNEYDPQAAALANAAPVELPPAIVVSRTYRCAPDNSLVYVEFYNNNTATIHTTRDGMPTRLSQTGGTGPFTAEGQTVSANATRTTINGKSCHT
jgi:hypothetical protein